jgi:hypothetical protein
MAKAITEVLFEGDQLVHVWTVNPTFSMGETTMQMMQGMLTDLRAKQTLVHEARTTLTRLVDEANDAAALAGSFITRGRSGIRAVYGPDSPQYDQVGGTRLSDRKPRKSKRATPNNPPA